MPNPRVNGHKTLIFTPTYNESENIGLLLRMILELNLPADILVVDDNSPDGTSQVVEKLSNENTNISLITRKGKEGIGTAHLLALSYAREKGYEILVTMDSDFSHQPSDIPRFIEASKIHDVIIGSRFTTDESLKEWNIVRKSITHLGHFLTKILLGMPFDASGGLRLYKLNNISPKILNSLDSQHYEFFFESLFALHKAGVSIGEVPVNLPARVYGHSKMEIKHIIRGVLRLINLGANKS